MILSYIMLTRYEDNVLSVFASLPPTLLPTNKASVFLYSMYILHNTINNISIDQSWFVPYSILRPSQ